MSTTTLKIITVPSIGSPRGARWTAALFVAAWQGLAGLLAELRRTPTRTEEASQVREMARLLQSTDPGFAADLQAAADRHESSAS